MFKNFQVIVDTAQKSKLNNIVVNSNDLQTFKLSITINQLNKPIDLTGATVRIAIVKPDKKTVFQDCTITNPTTGSCEVVLNTQAFIISGVYIAEVMIYFDTDKVAVTGRFSYSVAKGILDNTTEESKNDWQSITQAIADAEGILIDLRENGTGIDAEARSGLETVNTQLEEIVINVKNFGAVGDGVSNDTLAIQSALDYAAANRGVVQLPNSGIFGVSTLRLKNGIKGFISSGAKLKCLTALSEAVVCSDGPFFSTTPVDDIEIRNIKIDGNGLARRGFFLDFITNSLVEGNEVTNLGKHPSSNAGLYFRGASNTNKILRNKTVLPIDSPYGSVLSGVGIFLASNDVPSKGGLENDGQFVTSWTKPSNNIVAHNETYNGTHGISCYGGCDNQIHDNITIDPSHRCIILSPRSCNNHVHDNKGRGFLSSGIHMAYGANDNHIHDNELISPIANGEGVIQAYVGCKRNKIFNNTVNATTRYGIYLGVDAQDNRVINNTVSSVTRAGIAIESDWASTLPTGATFSRPNYEAPPPTMTRWAREHTFGNVIKNNKVVDLPNGSCSLYVAQIGVAENRNNIIESNEWLSVSSVYFQFFEELTGKLYDIVYNQNIIPRQNYGTSRVMSSRGRLHFASFKGNAKTNDAIYNVADGTTTPDAFLGDFLALANTTPTIVTDFLNGAEGQELLVKLSVNTTIKHDNAKIRLKGNVDITGVDGNKFIKLLRTSNIWFEIYRSY